MMYEWDLTELLRTSVTAGISLSVIFRRRRGPGYFRWVDALDLTCQVANEIYYLRLMAEELVYQEDILSGPKSLTGCLTGNQYMWTTGSVLLSLNMSDNSFVFEEKVWSEKKIIGFLPLWAHIVPRQGKSITQTSHGWDPSAFVWCQP